MIRQPCVSGLFYEDNPIELTKHIENLYSQVDNKSFDGNDIISGVVPHAGYVYSGLTASYLFKQLNDTNFPETFIIIGPNHTGITNSKVSLSSSDKWKTPLGDVDVDIEFIEELVKVNSINNIDESAHINEHSIEVELPFIQYNASKYNCKFKIVPIVISYQEKSICENLAKDIYEVSKKLNKNCMIIASTDLTHYEQADIAKFYDKKITTSIEKMDTNQLIKDIYEYDITMCGYGPTITAITYARLLNANKSTVLNYRNSGDAYGDYTSVVGYTSAMITK